jgi:hypothetical protein
LRTSPMSAAETCTEASLRPIHIKSETGKFSKNRAAVKCATIVSERHHEVSTGIMGNFVPLVPSSQSLHSGTESERTPLTR